jgi:hypothetical protein
MSAPSAKESANGSPPGSAAAAAQAAAASLSAANAGANGVGSGAPPGFGAAAARLVAVLQAVEDEDDDGDEEDDGVYGSGAGYVVASAAAPSEDEDPVLKEFATHAVKYLDALLTSLEAEEAAEEAAQMELEAAKVRLEEEETTEPAAKRRSVRIAEVGVAKAVAAAAAARTEATDKGATRVGRIHARGRNKRARSETRGAMISAIGTGTISGLGDDIRRFKQYQLTTQLAVTNLIPYLLNMPHSNVSEKYKVNVGDLFEDRLTEVCNLVYGPALTRALSIRWSTKKGPNLRDFFEIEDPKIQCKAIIGDYTETTRCWICRGLLKKGDALFGSPECEHVYSILLSLVISGLFDRRVQTILRDRSLEYINLLEHEYRWSHQRCNRVKTDIPFLHCKVKGKGVKTLVFSSHTVKILSLLNQILDTKVSGTAYVPTPDTIWTELSTEVFANDTNGKSPGSIGTKFPVSPGENADPTNSANAAAAASAAAAAAASSSSGKPTRAQWPAWRTPRLAAYTLQPYIDKLNKKNITAEDLVSRFVAGLIDRAVFLSPETVHAHLTDDRPPYLTKEQHTALAASLKRYRTMRKPKGGRRKTTIQRGGGLEDKGDQILLDVALTLTKAMYIGKLAQDCETAANKAANEAVPRAANGPPLSDEDALKLANAAAKAVTDTMEVYAYETDLAAVQHVHTTFTEMDTLSEEEWTPAVFEATFRRVVHSELKRTTWYHPEVYSQAWWMDKTDAADELTAAALPFAVSGRSSRAEPSRSVTGAAAAAATAVQTFGVLSSDPSSGIGLGGPILFMQGKPTNTGVSSTTAGTSSGSSGTVTPPEAAAAAAAAEAAEAAKAAAAQPVTPPRPPSGGPPASSPAQQPPKKEGGSLFDAGPRPAWL